jgi:hypothetical protein
MAAPLTTGAAPSPEQGVRRVATALLFLAAVALPCLVLYHAVAPAGVLVPPAAMLPWMQAAGPPHDDDEVNLVRTNDPSSFQGLVCCARTDERLHGDAMERIQSSWSIL